ncbi:MAG: RNA-guided endonuclease InsQ/TnpB family protein, partial [Acidobacteriota bacterium]
NLLANHSKTLGIPSHTLQGMLTTAYTAWQRCWKGLAKKPRLKGQRNQLNSIPFPDPFRPPENNRIVVPGLGSVRFHRQEIPDGKIKGGRIVRRASGWYLCLFIDAAPQAIPAAGYANAGIDPGFRHLLTLSSGENIPHPRELESAERRLAQAQRGQRKRLTARLQERIANRHKDRNHKLSRQLISAHACLVWSKDRHQAIARAFGKSVASSGHAQLRVMLAYKCTASGRRFLEVPSRYSTKTCSACGSLSGPTGYTGLTVRAWECAVCGTAHDRDINAAMNTLMLGLGIRHESRREAASGIPWP